MAENIKKKRKKNKQSTIFLAFVAVTSSVVVAVLGTSYSKKLPNCINLNMLSEQNIRRYYSSLNDLDIEERCGKNLLKNLRTIIHNGLIYYDYADIQKIYTITDRDWKNSPINKGISGNYDNSQNIIQNFDHQTEYQRNPFINMLYVDYSRNLPTHFLTAKGTSSFDKEHVWSQSRGFKCTPKAKGPAGTDLHHLMAGDVSVNRHFHSNFSYGKVYKVKKDGSKQKSMNGFFIDGNKLGFHVTSNFENEKSMVFEPNDASKGRIARALLYMVACYNNCSGEEKISKLDPNLELVNEIMETRDSVYSDEKTSAKYGVLNDILEWNRNFPPDEFEIYRNNLIHNNYQHNRNPFIDFPEWADYIWGNKNENYKITGYADPKNDKINKYKPIKRDKINNKKKRKSKAFKVEQHYFNDNIINNVYAILDDKKTIYKESFSENKVRIV